MGYRPFILASSLFIALMSAPAAASEPIEVVHRPAELVVDGASSDWPGAAAVVDSDDVRVSLAWDRQALYLGVQITDQAVVKGEPGDDPFAVDRVELRVDVDGSGGSLGEGDLRVLVGCNGSVMVFQGTGPSADGRVVMAGVGQVAGLQAAARSRSDGYDVELALPGSLAWGADLETGATLALDVLRADVQRGGAGPASLSSESWSWSGAPGERWHSVVLTGGPSLIQRAGHGLGPWLLALLASLLAGGGTATYFLARQRRQLARYRALAQRIEELERGTIDAPEPNPAPASPAIEVAPEPPAPVLSAFTVQPFDQTARDLAARLVELERLEAAGEVTGATEWRALAEMALAYTQAHLSENLSVAELAQGLHMSPRTLQRGLKRALGCTPRELLLSIRMREAKRLLKTGLHRVSDVAYQVGFEDPAHFSRRFKSYYGCSPSELVRQYRDAAGPESAG